MDIYLHPKIRTLGINFVTRFKVFIVLCSFSITGTFQAVDGCICINPGVLARGNGGTFMKMEIDLAMIGSKPGEFLPNCSLAENCQVKVVRI